MTSTKNPDKIYIGILGQLQKKKNSSEEKVILRLTDGFREILLEENYPAFEIINETFGNPDELQYEIIVNKQVIKRGMVKEKSLISKSDNQNSFQVPDSTGINFLMQAVTKSNEILASAQEKNLSSMFTMMQTNTSSMMMNMTDQFKQLISMQKDSNEHQIKIQKDEFEHKLKLQKEEFEFITKKKEELERIEGNDSVITSFFSKIGDLLNKIPEEQINALTAIAISKITGQPIVVSNTETEMKNAEYADA